MTVAAVIRVMASMIVVKGVVVGLLVIRRVRVIMIMIGMTVNRQ